MGLSGVSAGSLSPGNKRESRSPNPVGRKSSNKILEAFNSAASPTKETGSPSIKVTKLSMSRKLSKGASSKSITDTA